MPRPAARPKVQILQPVKVRVLAFHVQPNPDNRSTRPQRRANAPQYGDTYGSINGRPIPYRYGSNNRGSTRGSHYDFPWSNYAIRA